MADTQEPLFPPLPPPPSGALRVAAASHPDELSELATILGDRVWLGTSSWHFPGWSALVWDRPYPEAALSRHGLTAYAAHPLLRAVSLDRAFYRPLSATQYAELARQVPPDFRFVVKAPALVSDAHVRAAETGIAQETNPLFLDARMAIDTFVRPAIEGLGTRLGALVIQLSPLGDSWLRRLDDLYEKLATLFAACVPLLPPGVPIALEFRDAALLNPQLAALLKRSGVRYCLGLHDRLPSIEDQLPFLRATWPGPLVCRWNLQRGLRYGEAKARFEPFDRIQAPDPGTRGTLARVIAGTVAAGHAAIVTINNKAEGSAPLSVIELAKAIAAHKAQSP